MNDCLPQVFSLVLAIGIFNINSCQSETYYLNQAEGNNSNSGININNAFETADIAVAALSPGDTLIIVGDLFNPSYEPTYTFNNNLNDSQLWHQENTFKIYNLKGTSNAWITITSYNESTILRGDGANIIRIDNCAYIRIKNLIVIGEVLNIPYLTAKALQFIYKDINGIIQYRANPNLSDDEIANLTLPNIGTNIIRPSYTDTRGIYVSDSHHILIENNLISNTPGNGLRVAKSEYIDIIENEVVNTSRKSYSGTHGLVVTYTKDEIPQENAENYRCRILRNIVHHNYNEIYSWVGWKTFIHTYIDEGKGISLERNQNFNNSGRILIANNIAYWNGYAGINNHDGHNVDMIANTVYMNSYTNSITYANRTHKSGSNIGISINGGENCTIINNIAVIDASHTSWVGKALSIAGITGTLKVSNNIIYGIGNQTIQYDEDLNGIQENTIESDPKFVQYLSYRDAMRDYGHAFILNTDSPAIGAANYGYEPCEDVFGKERVNNTIGAVDIGVDSISVSNMRYLDECYTWVHNVTIDNGNNDMSVIRLYAVADGFIQYKENIFQATKDYLDVKSPSASVDFQMTHIRFNSPTQRLIENMTNCSDVNILNVSLLIKSTGYDLDTSNYLMLYLAFGNWNESQNTTQNVPSINDSQVMIGNISIDFKQDVWVSIPLNVTLLNKFNYTSMDTFEILITSTVGARVLQFYSRESGVNNTAQMELYVECLESSTTTTSEPAINTTTYYLNQATGNDSNSGTDINDAFHSPDTALQALTPGDTLIIVGELTNPAYNPTYIFSGNVNDSHLWHSENTLSINNINGTANNWITIRGYNESTIIKGDGSNIIRVKNSAYVRIINLNIIGQVLNIPYTTAKAMQFVYKNSNGTIKYRIDSSLNLTDDEIGNLTLPIIGSNIERSSYTDTRGIYGSQCHHIDVIGNKIINTPGNGLRFAYSEYINVIDNELTNTSRKSYSGTHALVLTYISDQLPQENDENYRAIVIRNIVHHNYNEIYSWVGTKDFIESKIDEGKGISLQRNQEFRNGGRILVANNIAYWNGYSGIHSQDGQNIDFIHNTAYMNSYTNSITYKYDNIKSGNNVGISMQTCENCTIINNIAVIDTSFENEGWVGYPISISSMTGTTIVSSNIIFGIGNGSLNYDTDLDGIEENTIENDPLFKEYLMHNNFMLDNGNAFEIMHNSPAIGNSYPGFVPCEDYFANNRMNNTIGAVTIDSDSYNVNNNYTESYLEGCYSWIPNSTLTKQKDANIISSYIFEMKAIEDGFIRYWQDDFKGKLDYLDVKHPTGSDLRETHLRFEFIESDFEAFINDSNATITSDNCQISKILLKMKSTSDDEDLTHNLLVYLAFGSWNELQNNTIGIPSINDSIAILASYPINLTANTWINIELNKSMVCTEIFDCINLFDTNYVYSWDIIVSVTYDARVLQFYSKESNPNNTATISIQIDCNNSIISNRSRTNSPITTTETTTTITETFTSEIETTQIDINNTILKYTFQVLAVKDGFIRYRENDFNGQLSYLDIKHPTGSDLRETYVGFNINLLDLVTNLNDSITDSNYICQITKTQLKMKSRGWDKDLTHNLLIYLIFGNWSESQTDTMNIPSKNDSIGILASKPIFLMKNKWVTMTLNQSLLCNELFECNDIFNNNTLTYEYNWNMIISTTQGARTLQFYSKESSISDAAQIILQIECNNTKLFTKFPTSQPSISPTIIEDESASNPMFLSVCYLSLVSVFLRL